MKFYSFPRALSRSSQREIFADKTPDSMVASLSARTPGILSPMRGSTLAANHMGFDDRGLIEPGLKADLVLFFMPRITRVLQTRNGENPPRSP